MDFKASLANLSLTTATLHRSKEMGPLNGLYTLF